jgi:uncharacterized protein involved in copper resistance
VTLFRFWLVVLLAVVLPVKGTMAAAMWCAPAGSTPAHMGAMAHGAEHGHAEHGHAEHGHDQHGHGKSTHDKCNLCASSCSSPSMPSTPPGLDGPEALTSQSFPDLPAPVPTFLSDGPERPPRTL